jgi:hypothetical protein
VPVGAGSPGRKGPAVRATADRASAREGATRVHRVRSLRPRQREVGNPRKGACQRERSAPTARFTAPAGRRALPSARQCVLAHDTDGRGQRRSTPAAARAATGSSPAGGRMRVSARRIRETGPRPSVGPRASEARPPRASATLTPWRNVIRLSRKTNGPWHELPTPSPPDAHQWRARVPPPLGPPIGIIAIPRTVSGASFAPRCTPLQCSALHRAVLHRFSPRRNSGETRLRVLDIPKTKLKIPS